MKSAPAQSQRGFTLLELAIVLIIISVVIGMSVSMSISVIATARLTATQQKMDAIGQALMQYRTANDRLPCPGDLTLAPGSADYGLEAGADASSTIGTGTGVCTGAGMLPAANSTAIGTTNTLATAAEGSLPALTLGLPANSMVDAWGNKFRYAVDITMTANAAFSYMPLSCVVGAITVSDGNGNARSSGSIYALVSHGPNGHGAYSKNGVTVSAGDSTADELTNCHCGPLGHPGAYSPNYVQKLPAYDSGHVGNARYYFDDLVTYKEQWQMQTPRDKIVPCSKLQMYVADGLNSRVQIFTYPGTYSSQFGSNGAGNGQFNNPEGVTLDSTGNVWVGDFTNDRVQKFSSTGTWLLNANAHNAGDVTVPIFDSSGILWFSNLGYSGIERFYNTGTYISTVSSHGITNGQVTAPEGMTFDSSGNLWVVDNGNNRVEEFTSGGSWLQTIPSSGCINGAAPVCPASSTNGQFNAPRYIAFASNGNFWVSDTANNRLEEFTPSGTFVMGIGAGYNGVSGSIGSSGGAKGQFNAPSGIAVDPYGNLWVVEASGQRVQEFTSNGVFIRKFASGGSGNGQLHNAQGIAIGSR